MTTLSREQPGMYRYVSTTLATSALAFAVTLTQLEQYLRVGSAAVFFATCVIGFIAAWRKLKRDK